MTKPSFRFKPGRVVELEHTSSRFGYLIAHFRRPRFGNFFTLVTQPFDRPLAPEHLPELLDLPVTTVWLNTYHLLATSGASTFRIKGDLSAYSVPEPPLWYGAVNHRITIWHPNGSRETRHTKLSEREWEAEMDRERITQMVLWLPQDIGAFLFDGVPLRWTAHKRF